MKLEIALQQWGYWLAFDGVISARELASIGQPDRNIEEGECTNKATGSPNYDDSIVKEIGTIIEELPNGQKIVLQSEYAGIRCLTRASQAAALGITASNYYYRLSVARKTLRLKSRFE